MGIVVTIFMLLGLLMVSSFSWLSLGAKKNERSIAHFIGNGLLLAGLWNAFWHGLRYADVFWGQAALVSGLLMILVSIIILKEYGSHKLATSRAIASIYKIINPLSILWIMGLLLSFLLYAVTLIQLNLGLDIIA